VPRTKVVCTIGPASKSPEILKRLIQSGMSVARLNFSHGTHLEHGQVMAAIRRLVTRIGQPLAILQDLAGPKIRIGQIKAERVTLKPGALFTLTSEPVQGSREKVSVSYPNLPRDVRNGDTLLLSDGALELQVLRRISKISNVEWLSAALSALIKESTFPRAPLKHQA
jgi:pyruvate kinase